MLKTIAPSQMKRVENRVMANTAITGEALMQCADRVRRMDEAYRQVEMQVLDELMKKFG